MTDSASQRDEPEHDGVEAAATNEDGEIEKEESDDTVTIRLPARFVASLPDEVLESLSPETRENLPLEVRRTVTRRSFTSMSMTMLGRVVNPIADRITPQHITDIIDITKSQAEYADRQSGREYADRKHARNWVGALVGLVVVAVAVIAVILVFQGLLDFLRDLARLIWPPLGGVGVGIAIGIRIGIRYGGSRNRQ